MAGVRVMSLSLDDDEIQPRKSNIKSQPIILKLPTARTNPHYHGQMNHIEEDTQYSDAYKLGNNQETGRWEPHSMINHFFTIV